MGRKAEMKSFFKNFIKKPIFDQRKKPTSSYRIPEMTWMSDLKKAADYGAILVKKGTPKKISIF